MNSAQRVSIHDKGNEYSNADSSEDYSIGLKAEELQQAFNNFQRFVKEMATDKEEIFEKEILEYSSRESALSRSPQDILKLCQKRIQKMLKNKKTKKNWNQEDIDILVWLMNKYTSFHTKKSVHQLDESDWKVISSMIPATSWKKCMFKWLSLKMFSLLTFRWSTEESDILSALIKQKGKKDWKILAQKLYTENPSKQKVFRTAKQCRQHWNCYLNPAIKKGPWSVKEDVRLLENVLELNCMKRWSEVAKSIKGRTQNAVKNRFSLLLGKEKKRSRDQSEKSLINRVLVKLLNDQRHERVQIESKQINQLEGPEIIYQEEEGKANEQKKQKNSTLICQIKTQGALKCQNEEQKSRIQVLIPRVVPNGSFYVQPPFFAVNPGFTPYMIGVMFGGHYQMN